MKTLKKTTVAAAFAMAALLVTANVQAVTVTDAFACPANVNVYVTATETIRVSTTYGFGWGGYAFQQTGTNKIQLVTANGLLRFNFANGGTVPKSYAYTIFNTAGTGAPPNTVVNTLAAVVPTFTAVPAGLEFRLLIRDGNNNWLLSADKWTAVVGAVNIPMATGGAGGNPVTWVQVTTPVAPAGPTDMDQLDSADNGPGDISPNLLNAPIAPNYNNVGGGGIYIETNTPTVNFDTTSISFMEPVGVLAINAVPQSTQPDLAVVPPPVPAPLVPSAALVTLSNAGAGPLTISPLGPGGIVITDLGPPAFAPPAVPPLVLPFPEPSVIAPGGSLPPFLVQFSPAVPGLSTGNLAILSDQNAAPPPFVTTNRPIRSGVIVDNRWNDGNGLWTAATWTLGHTPLFYERAILDTSPTLTNAGVFKVDSNGAHCMGLRVTSGTLSLTGDAQFNIGNASPATVDQTGGTVTRADAGGSSHTYIGQGAGGVGTYNLSGTGVLNTGRQFQIAQAAGSTGVLNLSGSGAVHVGRVMTIGNGVGANGTLNMSGGTLDQAATYAATMANTVGSVAAATITGGKVTLPTSLTVGNLGTATLTFGGTAVGVTGPLTVGAGVGGQGTVNVSGGTLTADSVTTGLGVMTAFNLSGGTLKTKSFFASSKPTSLPFNWTAGTLMINGPCGISLTAPAGATLAPGASIGTSTFTMGLTLLAGSNLDLELQAVPTLNKDQVIIDGSVLTLGGAVNVSLVGAEPTTPPFPSWDVIVTQNGGSIVLNSPTFNLPTPSGGAHFIYQADTSDPSKVTIRLAPPSGVEDWRSAMK